MCRFSILENLIVTGLRLRQLFDKFYWFADEDINVFFMALKLEFLNKVRANIVLLGTMLFYQIKSHFKYYLRTNTSLFGFKIDSSWKDMVEGKGKDENMCPPWWELSHVSLISHILHAIHI